MRGKAEHKLGAKSIILSKNEQDPLLRLSIPNMKVNVIYSNKRVCRNLPKIVRIVLKITNLNAPKDSNEHNSKNKH